MGDYQGLSDQLAIPLLRTLYGRRVVAMALYIKALRTFGGLSTDKFQLCFWNVGGGVCVSRVSAANAVDWVVFDSCGDVFVAKIGGVSWRVCS